MTLCILNKGDIVHLLVIPVAIIRTIFPCGYILCFHGNIGTILAPTQICTGQSCRHTGTSSHPTFALLAATVDYL